MKTGNWTLVLAPLLFSLVLSLQAKAHSQTYLPPTRQAFFHRLNSNFMEVAEEGNVYFDEKLGDYPFLARLIQKDFFKWDPSGKSQPQPAECDPTRLETADLQQLVHTCSRHWETNWKDILSNALGTMNLKMHPNRYPYGRHVIFHLPNHILLKGLLAMKPDGKKRPLIIFRTGIFSNSQEFYPERFLFLQMFEQSPFNILVLESLSGSEYLKHNDSFSLGGFDEGLQEFYIAKKLRSPDQPLSKSIDSVHMMGMSLGGHGVLFAALLNQLNPGADGKPVVQSALTFCPLLNLQETLDFHQSQGFSMDLMNYWASRRLKEVKSKLPGLKDDNFISDFFQAIQKNYRGPLIADKVFVEGIRLPVEVEKILQTEKRPADLYWQLNNFWPWYLKVQTPVVMYSTRKDPIVPWFINSGRLEDGRMKFENSNVQMLSFAQGFHCSFPVAYDWGAMTHLFQSSIFRNSVSFHQQEKQLRVPLSQEALQAVTEQKAKLDLNFEAPLQSSALSTSVRFEQQTDTSFTARWLAWWTEPVMKLQLPLADMEFPIEQIVRSADEASLLRRWAYQNIRAEIQGRDLVFRWKVTAP